MLSPVKFRHSSDVQCTEASIWGEYSIWNFCSLHTLKIFYTSASSGYDKAIMFKVGNFKSSLAPSASMRACSILEMKKLAATVMDTNRLVDSAPRSKVLNKETGYCQ